MTQAAVFFHAVDNRQAATTRLFQRVGGCDALIAAFQDDVFLIHPLDIAHMPVLDFQAPQTVAGVKDEEIRVAADTAAGGNVVPDEIVIIEVVMQELGEAFFANRHFAFFQGGEDLCHGVSLCCGWLSAGIIPPLGGCC